MKSKTDDDTLNYFLGLGVGAFLAWFMVAMTRSLWGPTITLIVFLIIELIVLWGGRR